MDFVAQARRQMLAGQMKDARDELLSSLEGLESDDMTLPGVCGDWSVAQVLAHVAAWDRASTNAFRQMVSGERPPFIDLDEEGVQQFNEDAHARHNPISPEDALSELIAAREELLDFLRELDNRSMFAPAPGDESADMSIAACLAVQIDHDQEHAQMIRDWRDEVASDS